jgi:hypothetical protein
MTDKEALAWELEHRAELVTPEDLAAALAFERARSEAILRGYIRAMETILAALSKPPLDREVRHDA